MKKNWLFVFGIVLIADLVAVYLKNETLVSLAKPVVVIALIIYFLSATAGITNGLKKLITVALVFSWLGDVLLMFESSDKNFFLFGLVAFLIAHIFYIISFKKLITGEKLRLKWPLILPVLIYYGGLMYLLNPHLGDMLWAVRVYGFVISTMFLLAVHMLFIKNRTAGNLMMIGALLFVASDSVLAINKFYQSFEFAGIITMLTYGLAQLLITLGAANYIHSISGKK
jgi:uncharacterized membrane protein YhhN